jgi:hypothetical protein
VITGYWCDLHRGTATDVRTYEPAPHAMVSICSDCWAAMADQRRHAYGLPVGPACRVNLRPLRRVLVAGSHP